MTYQHFTKNRNRITKSRGISVSDLLWEEIKQRARDEGTSISSLVRDALKKAGYNGGMYGK